MAYKITDACTNCGTCESECPVSAISEKDNARWIDPDICIDCGVCVPVCPEEAIIAG
ncbi:MAG TPA: ferredoxin [Spirochaetaceae bacterium]|nr:ferredoxin [Spirochaetaceae bacterium]